MTLMYSEDHVQQLVDHIHSMQDLVDYLNEENTRLFRENNSYKAWMNRSIAKIKEMQS